MAERFGDVVVGQPEFPNIREPTATLLARWEPHAQRSWLKEDAWSNCKSYDHGGEC